MKKQSNSLSTGGLILMIFIIGVMLKFWYILLGLIILGIIITIVIKKKTPNEIDSNLATKTQLEEKQSLPALQEENQKLTDYVIFDIETTGLSRINDKIIQLSAVKYQNDQIIDQYNTFVNPHCQLETKISYLTGITDDDLIDAPEIDEVIEKFTKFVDGYTLIGHNIRKFDLPFLFNNGYTAQDIKYVDTYLLAQETAIDTPNLKLATLKDHFGIQNRSHNALNDCHTNAIVYQKLRDNDLAAVKVEYEQLSQCLAGKRVSITGQFIGISREEIKQEIIEHGGRYTSSVSSLTDYLIKGTQIASNLTDGVHSLSELKAQKFQDEGGKIQIIDYDEFKDLISENSN